MSGYRFARRMAPALFLAVFLTACGGSTNQPAIDAAQFQSRLDEMVKAITTPEPNSEVTVKAEGPAKVETASDGTVTGTFPRLLISGKDGNKTTLDPIAIKFLAGDGDRIPFEATLPSSLTITDKDNKNVGDVKIGSQTLKGVWVEKLQTIDDLDMQLGNLVITAPGEEGSGKVDQIAFTGKLESKGGGLYDGKYEIKVSGFAVNDPATKSAVKMALLSVSSTLTGARLEDWAKAAVEAGYTIKNPAVFKMWAGGAMDPKMLAFLKRMPEFMGEVTYNYTVTGLEATEDNKTAFTMKTASFGFGAGSDGQGQTKFHLTAGVGGLGTSPEAPMLPPEADIQDASFEMTATGVPGGQLWSIYVDALPSIQAEAAKAASAGASGNEAAATGDMEQLSGELSAKFLQVISTAKLAVALNKLSLLTPTARMTGNGTATYLPATQMLPEGKFSFRFSGLDALASAMEKRGKDDEMAQQLMGVIGAVRAMGKPDPASTPTDPAYVIDIEITKDGKILANGQDMMGGQ